MTAIRIRQLRKTYGRTIAVDSIDLDVEPSEVFFLLGPSGCGKTTLLRMVAGFIEPTAGKVFFDGREVTRVAPNRRNTGMVFQNYALWPHMSVFNNVAYGLGVRKIARDERRDRTMAALRMVQMHEHADRKPNQLSGGQQQRVALARALVIQPSVLLLDEPLSNLDARLRIELRERIREICNETGITTLYVTHDQKEALSMADRIAVMREGRIIQTDRPRVLYSRPKSRFVASFLGETNFIPAEVSTATDGSVVLRTAAGDVKSTAFDESTPRSGNVTCSIRPESFRILEGTPSGNRGNVITGKRLKTVFLGELAQHDMVLDDGTVLKVFELDPPLEPRAGERMTLAVDPAEVVILSD